MTAEQHSTDRVPVELVTITYEIGVDGARVTSRQVDATAWIPAPRFEACTGCYAAAAGLADYYPPCTCQEATDE